MYKIASLESGDHNLIKKVAETGKPLIISTGATYWGEIEELVDLSQRLEQFTERDMKAQYSMLRTTNKGRGKRFDPNDPFNH